MAYKTHLFVCTNSPDRPEKCGSKGAENLRRRIKEKCFEKYGKEVRVNASGCLGHCEKGIAAVVYPKGEWLFELKETDDQKLLDLVENFQIPD
jgi:predicted metal-binding protein